MYLVTDEQPSTTVVHVTGELDLATSLTLDRTLRDLKSNTGVIVLDLHARRSSTALASKRCCARMSRPGGQAGGSWCDVARRRWTSCCG
jgi:hypothetical protein